MPHSDHCRYDFHRFKYAGPRWDAYQLERKERALIDYDWALQQGIPVRIPIDAIGDHDMDVCGVRYRDGRPLVVDAPAPPAPTTAPRPRACEVRRAARARRRQRRAAEVV